MAPENHSYLAKALKIFPGGAQTDAKCIDKRCLDAHPSFFVRGNGAYAQDPDGRWWLDCQMGLGAYALGYADEAVNRAVELQLRRGSIFSLPSTLEIEVGEKLLQLFPEFEQLRFSKNGSDVTSAAIRIARSKTGRDAVIACGYHGFQDWSMSLKAGRTGIPEPVRNLTHGSAVVDLELSIDLIARDPSKYAALIVDTGGQGLPSRELLETALAVCRRFGVVFIMDEIISGFRAHQRGVMGLYEMAPDMLCLGKAIANGFPLAALLGSKTLMDLAPDAGMTATFAGDCTALAACSAVIDVLGDGVVLDGIRDVGQQLMAETQTRIAAHGLQDHLTVTGFPALSKIASLGATADPAMDLLMRGFAKDAIFWTGSFVLCQGFEVEEVHRVASALDDVLPELKEHISDLVCVAQH